MRNTLGYTLNADQEKAYAEINASIQARRQHLVTGDAGTGKTVLAQVVAATHFESWRDRIVACAPTHQACSVLRFKLRSMGIKMPVVTAHTLLGLRPKPKGDRLVFERDKHSEPINADIVIADETSMIGINLFEHFERWASQRAVIWFGDEGQLFPVGETRSPTFDTEHHSHLSKPERQGAGNPILRAAWAIRKSQTEGPDWSWCAPSHEGPYGVFVPRDPSAWLKKAFTSDEFEADSLHFRYLAWTNKTVADVNARVRRWRYGPTNTPFVVGERALIRAPLIRKRKIVLHTNEEVIVQSISPSRDRGVDTWAMTVKTDDGADVEAHMARNQDEFQRKLGRLADEARQGTAQWGAFHAFKDALIAAQSPYALTTHNVQGLTLRNAFVDIPEMRRWVGSNQDEGLRGLYVDATRATHGLICVGA